MSACKPCIRLQASAWRRKNLLKTKQWARSRYLRNKQQVADYGRRLRLWDKFKLTVEDYDRMLAAQRGCCAICGTDVPRGAGRFHVDHNHRSGEVRGLLCNNCNIGLGAFDDDVARLSGAIAYLKAHSERKAA